MADDFLKNDGQKFLSLMEELASRRIRPIDDEEDKNAEIHSDEEDWDDVYDEDEEEEYDEEEVVLFFSYFCVESRPHIFMKRRKHSLNNSEWWKDGECFKSLLRKCLSSVF